MERDLMLEDALDYLKEKLKLPKDKPQALSRENWRAVGMALKEKGYPLSVWDNWSKADTARYKPGECEEQWLKEFRGSTHPVKAGSIIQMAKDRGWIPKPSTVGRLDFDSVIDFNQDPSGLSDLTPVEELKTYLKALFEPESYVGYVTKDSFQDKEGKWKPKAGIYNRKAGDLIESLDKYPDDLSKTIGPWNSSAGAWIRINALDGKGAKNENVVSFQHVLVESDSLSLQEQEHLFRELDLPIATMTSSGGKSIHAVVKVDAANLDEYKKRVRFLYSFLKERGVPIDIQNSNPSRLSRMPGVTRNGNRQQLLAVNIGKASWDEWYESVNQEKSIQVIGNPIKGDNMTAFSGCPVSLRCGSWIASDDGIKGYWGLKNVEVIACPHPIIPIRRIVNSESGTEQIELLYKVAGVWKKCVTNRYVISDHKSIVKLSDRGISVTSLTANYLIQYLNDVLVLNSYNPDSEALIPEIPATSKLGFSPDGNSFFPYFSNMEFDGDPEYRSIYEAYSNHKGDPITWKDHIKQLRSIHHKADGEVDHIGNLITRIVIDASFASPILNKLDMLSFILHIWSTESGNGKTVALMAAQSVWGHPDKYLSWNSTKNALERYASFLNNLPLVLDEYQLGKQNKDKAENIYQLAEGQSKSRAKPYSLEKKSYWRLCAISSGETPINTEYDGAGSLNRVLEIEIPPNCYLIQDGHKTAEILRKNYGFAGEEWIDLILNKHPEIIDEEIRSAYDAFYPELTKQGFTDKQAMIGSVLIGVDIALQNHIFHEEEMILPDDIAFCLKKKSDVDINERAVRYIYDWLAINTMKFIPSSGIDPSGYEVYGEKTTYSYKVIKTVFDDACEKGRFSANATAKHLKRKGLLRCTRNSVSQTGKVGNIRTNYIEILNLPDPDSEPSTKS